MSHLRTQPWEEEIPEMSFHTFIPYKGASEELEEKTGLTNLKKLLEDNQIMVEEREKGEIRRFNTHINIRKKLLLVVEKYDAIHWCSIDPVLARGNFKRGYYGGENGSPVQRWSVTFFYITHKMGGYHFLQRASTRNHFYSTWCNFGGRVLEKYANRSMGSSTVDTASYMFDNDLRVPVKPIAAWATSPGSPIDMINKAIKKDIRYIETLPQFQTPQHILISQHEERQQAALKFDRMEAISTVCGITSRFDPTKQVS